MIGNSDWWMWVLFLGLFMLPAAYGWRVRSWGPPLPSYLQRRRAERATAAGPVDTSNAAAFDHHAWGWGGDVLWIMLIAWIMWSFGFLFRH
jgi:hypothetical protein